MKKFCIVLLVLVLLIGAGIFALTQYISVDEVQKRVITAVKEKTGRDLAFTSMRFGFFPNIGLRLKDVTLTNPGWAADKTMVTLGELNLGLALKPLFSKQIEVTRFVLDHPVIHLEVSADGKKSWEFAALKAKEQPEGKAGAPEAKITSDLGFKFSQFEIKKGTLTLVNHQKGTNISLTEIDAVVKYPDLASALQVDGTVIYHDKRVNIFASLDAPIDFLNGKPSPGNLNVKTGDFETKLEGRLATTGTMLDGKIEADVSSLSNFVAWLNGAKPKPLPFEKISFTSAAQATGTNLTLNNAALKLDEVEAKGNVSLGYGGAKPLLKAKVAVNKLNLDRFTGHAEQARAGESATIKKKEPQADWDNEPIDFSGLKAVDADLTLQTQGFSLRGAEVGPSTLSVQLADGSLHARSSEATLFGGAFSSDVTVIASATPALAFKFNMKDVQTKPLLTTFADFKKMSGTVDTAVDVSANGKSQKAIVESLAGNGSVTFHNGTLEGIDLVNIAQAIESRLGEMGIGGGKTEFVDLGGTFTIKTGVIHNEDLKMRGPLVQATGSGDVNLPIKRVDYRVMPLLTASSKTEGAKGVVVPVDIRGPFNNIKVKPDYKGAIQGILDHPEDAKAAIKNVREKGKTILQGIRKDPKNALGNLLGGGLFGKKAAPADTEPAPVVSPDTETQPDTAPAPVTTP